VRGPQRLIARIVDHQVAVGLHGGDPGRGTRGGAGPERFVGGVVDHQVAVVLIDQPGVAVGGMDALVRYAAICGWMSEVNKLLDRGAELNANAGRCTAD
jgi:hypothetical protein